MAQVRWRSYARKLATRRAAAAAVPFALVALVAACTPSAGGAQRAGHAPLQQAFKAVVRKALPSVVEISADGTTGSGVVLNDRGYIVTNDHVVGSKRHFEVRSSVVSKPLRAFLVGVFAPDDLAVIKVGRGSGQLKPARWGNSAHVQVGDVVLAMGSPYGLNDSVTDGIVSATGRTVTGPDAAGRPPAVITDAIQTSAPINPGNSGGALVLLSGNVIGIPTFAARDPELGTAVDGIGFAIPSDTVLDIADQLIKHGKVTRSGRASLQFSGRTHVGPQSKPDGVTVDGVTPGGAAARAGIRAGDVIVGMGGAAVASLNTLNDALLTYQPGAKVTVEVLRNGNPRQLSVRLGSLPG